MRAHHWQPAVARFWRAALRGTHVRQHPPATLRSAASVTRRPLRVRRGLARRQLLASQLWSLPERRGSARQGHVDVVCTGPRPALRPARARRSPGGSIFRRSPSTRTCVCDVKCVCVCVCPRRGGSPLRVGSTYHLFFSFLTNDCGLLHYQVHAWSPQPLALPQCAGILTRTLSCARGHAHHSPGLSVSCPTGLRIHLVP